MTWAPGCGDLYRGRAHAAGRARHEDALARLEVGLGDEGVEGRREDLGEPAGLGPVEWSGTGRACVSSTTAQCVACAPPPTTAMTRSPGAKRVTCVRRRPPRRPAPCRGCPRATRRRRVVAAALHRSAALIPAPAPPPAARCPRDRSCRSSQYNWPSRDHHGAHAGHLRGPAHGRRGR